MDTTKLMQFFQEMIVLHGINIIIALIIFIIGRWIAKALRSFTARLLTKKNADPAVNSFVCSVLSSLLPHLRR